MSTPSRPTACQWRSQIPLALALLTAIGVSLSNRAVADEPKARRPKPEPLSFSDAGRDISKAAGTVGDVLPESVPGLVLALAFSPDGKLLALGGENPSVALRDAATNKTKAVLTAHTAPVTCLAFAPDGMTLATGGHDRSVKLWEVAKGAERLTLVGHSSWVNAVAFAPDGKTIASAGQEGTIKLWDTADGRALATLDGPDGPVRAVAFAPDGATLAVASGRVVTIWDVATRELRGVWKGHRGAVRALVFSADGRTLASAGEDHVVRLWDVAEGKPRASIAGHSDQVLALAFSPGGQGLATAGYDGSIKVWETAAEPREPISAAQGQAEGFTALAFDPKTGKLASAAYDHTVRLRTPQIVPARLRLTLPRQSGPVAHGSFSPDGKRFATADPEDFSIRLWDAVSWTETGRLAGHTSNVNDIQFSRDGGRVLTVANDSRLLLWDAHAQTIVAELNDRTPGSPAALAPDGKSVVIGGESLTVVIWDVAKDTRRPLLPSTPGVKERLLLSPDGTTLLVVSRAPNNNTQRFVKLYDVADGRQRGAVVLAGVAMVQARFSADGKTVAAATAPANGGPAQTIAFWDTKSLAEWGKLTGLSFVVESFSVSPDGRFFATGDGQGMATFWDFATRTRRASLKAHPGTLYHTGFSPDGRSAVTVGSAANRIGDVRVWDLNPDAFAAPQNELLPYMLSAGLQLFPEIRAAAKNDAASGSSK